MATPMSPWIALVLGILIGWVLEWLLELFFFRRQRLECQLRLSDLESALVERQEQLSRARTRIKTLEADAARLTARGDMGSGTRGTAVQGIALEAAMPDVALRPSAPDPSRKATVPDAYLGVAVPDVDMRASMPEVDLGVAVPDVDLRAAAPEVDLGVAVPDVDLNASLPDVDLEAAVPDVDLGATVPEVDLGVAVPDVDMRAAAPEVGLGVAVPDVGLKASLPDVDLGIAVPDVDLKAAATDLSTGALSATLAAGAVAGIAAQRLGAGLGAARTITCPQDLSRIDGIGTVFEQKLYNAGIGSFWGLAQADDDLLRGTLTALFEVDLAAIKADAMRLAEQTGTVGYVWDGTQPDDFEPFAGLGEVFESRLYEAGICTYRALAVCTVDQLQAICKAPEWRRPPYAAWVARAEQLAGRKD